MSSTETRARADSGMIDLFAIDRDARAQATADAARKKIDDDARSLVPPPVMRDIGGALPDDVDSFEAAIGSPWKRMAKWKIGLGASALVVALIGIVSAASGPSGPSKKELIEKANAAAEAQKAADRAKADAEFAALKAAAPPPAPVAATPEPAKPVKVAATNASHKPAATKARKGVRKGAGGPKMIKVQSSGVETAS